MKKKLPALCLALTLLLACAGCTGTPVALGSQQEEPPAQDTDPDANINTDSGGALYTGLYAVGSLSSSASAGEKDGLVQADVTIVAVTVDHSGVIQDCAIDAVQAKANFDGQGNLLTDLSAPVRSKNELGPDYGMVKASSIGKEWNEQAAALADYVVGKTADEVLGIAVDQATKPADADLSASVTISIGGFQALLEKLR